MSSTSRLLLVDDERDLVRSLKEGLELHGYAVQTALDGVAALEQVKQAKPDMILLDLMLPKLNGFKVCRLLKFDEQTRKIPILILSARAQGQDVRLAVECGADGYLTKPFTTQELLNKLERLLAGREGRAPNGNGNGHDSDNGNGHGNGAAAGNA